MNCNCCGSKLIEDFLGIYCPNESCESIDGITKIEICPRRKYWYAIEFFDGRKFWYKNGKLLREDGPAIEYSDGKKEYWIDGKRHREDGPAVEYTNGYQEYWINGEIIK